MKADLKRAPTKPQLQVDELSSRLGLRRFAWDTETGLFWIWVPSRIRTYVCSVGVSHRAYWRTHWRQGRDDFVACEHEVEVLVKV